MNTNQNDYIIITDSGDSTTTINDISIDLSQPDHCMDMASTCISTLDLSDTVTLSINTNAADYYTTTASTTFTISDDYLHPSKTEFNELVTRLEKIEQIITEEEEIRRNQPAVKQAYDEYRLLLELAKPNKKLLTDE